MKRDARGAIVPMQTNRWIWTDEAMHQFQPDQKKHFVWPISTGDRGRLPAVLALPFLWNTNVEGLKSRYRIELVKEAAEIWSFRITPLTEAGRTWFSKAWLVLDRATYLPRRYVVVSPDGKSTKDYRVTEARSDQAVPDEVLRIPTDDGWEVIRPERGTRIEWWLSRYLPSDLLP